MLFYALPLQANGNVAALVNGVAISALQLDVAVSQQIATSTFHGNISDEKRSEFQEQALQGLILRELQYQDAVSRGFKPDNKLVKTRIAAIRNKFNS